MKHPYDSPTFVVKVRYNSELFLFAVDNPDKIKIAPLINDDSGMNFQLTFDSAYVITAEVSRRSRSESSFNFYPEVLQSARYAGCTIRMTPTEVAVHTEGSEPAGRGMHVFWKVIHFPADAVPTKKQLDSGEWDVARLAREAKTSFILDHRIVVWSTVAKHGEERIVLSVFDRGVPCESSQFPYFSEEPLVGKKGESERDVHNRISDYIGCGIRIGELPEGFSEKLIVIHAGSDMIRAFGDAGALPWKMLERLSKANPP